MSKKSRHKRDQCSTARQSQQNNHTIQSILAKPKFCFCRRLQRHSKFNKQAYSVTSYWAFISNANGSCHSLQVVRVGITFLSCWLTHNSTGDRQSDTFEIKMQPEQKLLMGGTVGRWDLKDETFFISFNFLIEKSTFIYISHKLHGFKKCFINFFVVHVCVLTISMSMCHMPALCP